MWESVPSLVVALEELAETIPKKQTVWCILKLYMTTSALLNMRCSQGQKHCMCPWMLEFCDTKVLFNSTTNLSSLLAVYPTLGSDPHRKPMRIMPCGIFL